ncbi:MAG: hypothetical protein IRZ02_06685 [Acidothermus sp.]|nr:hypothetical protein [Acidothermus sp.]MCL6537896.1 hypothetical protein [Acidothermus sp.]
MTNLVTTCATPLLPALADPRFFAANPTKSPNGGLGLLVVLLLAVAVYFLFRSMNKHLKKAASLRDDDHGDGRGDAPPPRPDGR